jgi:hypothetical protein
MKTNVARWRQLIKEINDVIIHSKEQGLPLESIELDAEEWDAFVIARTTLATGNRLPTQEFDCGTARYKGTRIYREKKDA